MGLLSDLGVDIDLSKEVQKVATGRITPAGVKKMAIERAYYKKSQGGALGAFVDFIYPKEDGEDGEMSKYFWSTYISSGDEKGNKFTYTDKNNKEQPLPGLIEFNHLLQAVGEVDPETKEATIELFNEQTEIKAMPSLTGKKCILGIRHKYDDYKEADVAFVDAFLTEDGKNSVGVDLLEALTEKIEKSPFKKTKAKPKAKPSVTGAEADTADEAGW